MKAIFKPREKDTAESLEDCAGFSAYVVFGRYGGFGGGVDGSVLRITLGWVAFGFAAVDLERFFGLLSRRLQARDEK